MDPITIFNLGQIRQQEYLEQAEAWRYTEPIWERIYRWAAPRIAARRQNRAASEALDTCVTAADNC
jgi:hypothetical protein